MQKVNIGLESNCTFFKNNEEFAKKHLKNLAKKYQVPFVIIQCHILKSTNWFWKGQKIAQVMYIVSDVSDR